MPARILVVDDADQAETLARLLRRFGHTCGTASSAHDAIAGIRTARPQLIVMDLHVRGVDGLAVLRGAREMGQPVAVVVMTAYPRREGQAPVPGLEGAWYLRKPFANAEFLRVVHDALSAG